MLAPCAPSVKVALVCSVEADKMIDDPLVVSEEVPFVNRETIMTPDDPVVVAKDEVGTV